MSLMPSAGVPTGASRAFSLAFHPCRFIAKISRLGDEANHEVALVSNAGYTINAFLVVIMLFAEEVLDAKRFHVRFTRIFAFKDLVFVQLFTQIDSRHFVSCQFQYLLVISDVGQLAASEKRHP